MRAAFKEAALKSLMLMRQRAWWLNGRIVPSFVIFSPGIPYNASPTVLPVFRNWISWLLQEINLEANHTLSTLIASVDTTSGSMAKVLSCNAGECAQKVGTILPLSYQALYANHISNITLPVWLLRESISRNGWSYNFKCILIFSSI